MQKYSMVLFAFGILVLLFGWTITAAHAGCSVAFDVNFSGNLVSDSVVEGIEPCRSDAHYCDGVQRILAVDTFRFDTDHGQNFGVKIRKLCMFFPANNDNGLPDDNWLCSSVDMRFSNDPNADGTTDLNNDICSVTQGSDPPDSTGMYINFIDQNGDLRALVYDGDRHVGECDSNDLTVTRTGTFPSADDEWTVVGGTACLTNGYGNDPKEPIYMPFTMTLTAQEPVAGEPPPAPTCEPAGQMCQLNADCCSNKCKGKPGFKTCN